MIAVASGKGGVGKSSLTVNLAAAFAALGREVGVLDADIYGHSIPHMLGIRQKPVLVDRLMIPPVKHDLKLMSIGFFLDDNQPVMWRGPMLHRALEQFLQDVHWGDLDVLVVDMPPGTGDVSISLGQLLPRAEAVVVTTPQPLAQEVASRAAEMAQKTGMRLARRDREHDVARSSARAAASGSRPSSACRSSARCRSTRGCGRRPTRASRSSSSDPDSRAGAGDLRDRARDRREPRRRLHAHAAARLLSVRPARHAPGSRRSASAPPTSRCSPRTSSTAERAGRAGHGLAADRVARDARTGSSPPRARSASSRSRGTSAGTATARSATSSLDGVVEAQLADPPRARAGRRRRRTFPTGMLGHWTRRLAEGGPRRAR